MVRCDWAMAKRPGYASFEAYHKLNISFSKMKKQNKGKEKGSGNKGHNMRITDHNQTE